MPRHRSSTRTSRYPESEALSPDYTHSSRHTSSHRDEYGRSSQDPYSRSSSYQNQELYAMDLYGPTSNHRDLYSMSGTTREDPYAPSTSKPKKRRATRNARDKDPFESSYRSLPIYGGGREASTAVPRSDYRSSSSSGRYPGDRISLLTEPLDSSYGRDRESSRRAEDSYRDDRELSRYYGDPYSSSGVQTKRTTRDICDTSGQDWYRRIR
ncbi:MAG: hypothetical protein Q9187_000407 [Circinaria calcarea]